MNALQMQAILLPPGVLAAMARQSQTEGAIADAATTLTAEGSKSLANLENLLDALTVHLKTVFLQTVQALKARLQADPTASDE